jgi:hypothetical protein
MERSVGPGRGSEQDLFESWAAQREHRCVVAHGTEDGPAGDQTTKISTVRMLEANASPASSKPLPPPDPLHPLSRCLPAFAATQQWPRHTRRHRSAHESRYGTLSSPCVVARREPSDTACLGARRQPRVVAGIGRQRVPGSYGGGRRVERSMRSPGAFARGVRAVFRFEHAKARLRLPRGSTIERRHYLERSPPQYTSGHELRIAAAISHARNSTRPEMLERERS